MEETRELTLEDMIPALGGNLMVLIGEWRNWDPAWVLEVTKGRRRSQRTWAGRLWGGCTKFILDFYVREYVVRCLDRS